MNLVLKTMGSTIGESSLLPMSDNGPQNKRNCLSRVKAFSSALVLMHKDVKLRQIMSEFKEDIDNIIQKVHSLQVT